jgi:serralysin
MANQTNATAGSGYGNAYIDSLVWGCQWTETGTPGVASVANPIDISYSFGIGGLGISTDSWSTQEMNAFNLALQLYENVCNINFNLETHTTWYPSQSDMVFYQVTASALGGPTNLGMMEVPNASFTSTYGYFNYQHSTWSNLDQGSYGFITIIHELGHGLGLAHPHDGGSENDGTNFPGVTSSADSGDDDLNQGIWTTMTYLDGWAGQPATSYSYGYQATPMAFDIAALQAIYGANTNFNTGANTYVLPQANASGTFWSCIWDAGGVDTISNVNGSLGCVINLNAAPLTGVNAGGYVSWSSGVVGGYTIANGVVIENAVGGSGHDSITGNNYNNTLQGGLGNDTLDGG